MDSSTLIAPDEYGMSTQEIASALHIKERMVQTHLASAIRKLRAAGQVNRFAALVTRNGKRY